MRKLHRILVLLPVTLAGMTSSCGFTNNKTGSSTANGTATGGSAAPVSPANPPTNGTVTAPAIPTTPATFAEVNQQILVPKCLSCHGAGASPDFSSYSSFAQDTRYVMPGNAAQSAIYTATENGSMPRGAAALTATELGLIYSWIEGGAKND